MITTTLEVALLVTTVEFGLLAIAILFFSCRGARAVEASTTAEATELVSKVTDTEEARRGALETVFRDKYQFEGDELGDLVEEFVQREKAFYNAIVGAFLGRGDTKLANLSDELTKVVAPWISMTPKNMLDAESAQNLVDEKEQLQSELVDTKQVLDKMMAEYNRAFRIDSPDADPEQAEPESAAPDAVDSEMAELDDLDDLDEIDSGEGVSIDLGEGDDVDTDGEPQVVDTATGESAEADDDDQELEFSTSEQAAPDDDEETANDDVAEPAAEADSEGTEVASDNSAENELEEFDDDDESAAADEDDGESATANTDSEDIDRGEQPMTAEDLDELMESLEEA